MDFRQEVVGLISSQIELPKEKINSLIERPENPEMGGCAFPAFILAKTLHKNPAEIAKAIVANLSDDNFEKIQAVGSYVDSSVKKSALIFQTLEEVLVKKNSYGNQNLGSGNVAIGTSSPNIAKPMPMGHLRSTVIGNSIAKILAKVGYTPVKINHLGDYGTRFGKLITAYKLWGNEEDVKKDPTNSLPHYYVKFHGVTEEKPEPEDEGRAWFKKPEGGDSEAARLWNWFRKVSLQEFSRIYKKSNVEFDSYHGEVFYNDKMDAIVDELRQKDLPVESRGAQVIDLGPDKNPATILKSDDTSIYTTRDLAAAEYREKYYDFVQALYVVGNEQFAYFEQLREVLKKMGHEWADDIYHIPFGLITQGSKKLSTRKGNVVFLDKVLEDAVEFAMKQIETKNPSLPNKEQVANEVGIGTVVFHDLKNDRLDAFDFNLEEMVHSEGETGPYVQYTNARAQSILRKVNQIVTIDELDLSDEWAFAVAKGLADFPIVLAKASEKYEPSVIAKFTLELAKHFNKYYANVRIPDEDDQLTACLVLVETTSIALTESLHLLGVAAPKEMQV